MIKRFFLTSNGTLGELNDPTSTDDTLKFECINGAWRGEISKDGKHLHVYATDDTYESSIIWTDDELPIDGDYNKNIAHIRKLKGYAD